MQYFMGLYTDNKPLFFAAVMAAIFLLVLLLVLLRRMFSGRGLRAPGNSRTRQIRLGVVDVQDLDRERQLVLVRRDNVEHLIMIGGPNDLLIESSIIRVEARPTRERETPSAPGIPAQSTNGPTPLRVVQPPAVTSNQIVQPEKLAAATPTPLAPVRQTSPGPVEKPPLASPARKSEQEAQRQAITSAMTAAISAPLPAANAALPATATPIAPAAAAIKPVLPAAAAPASVQPLRQAEPARAAPVPPAIPAVAPQPPAAKPGQMPALPAPVPVARPLVPALSASKADGALAAMPAPPVPSAATPRPASERFPPMNLSRPPVLRQNFVPAVLPAAPTPVSAPILDAPVAQPAPPRPVVPVPPKPPAMAELPVQSIVTPESTAALDSLEEEMAKLLGRPLSPTR